MAEPQPPEGLRKIMMQAVIDFSETWNGEFGDYPQDMAEAMLTALFDACTVREQPHMWLHGGIRTERSLILSYRLPDEPMPEPGPMHPDLAAALARAKARVSSTGEETTGGN